MVISKPIVHVMSKPIMRHHTQEQSSLQETQVLFGEHIVAYFEKNGWLKIKTLDQDIFLNGQWDKYSGWVPKDSAVPADTFPQENIVVTAHHATLHTTLNNQDYSLSFGTYLLGIKQTDNLWKLKLAENVFGHVKNSEVSLIKKELTHQEKRNLICERGMLFLGDPYLWGGRSAYDHNHEIISGFDCSGLTQILYRSIGLAIPRDSHDQYLKSKKTSLLSSKNIGDLIFGYYENNGIMSNRIAHVMIYLGEDKILEAEGELASNIRIVRGEHRFGKKIENIRSGDVVWHYRKLSESPLGNKNYVTNSQSGKCKLVFGSYIE